MNGSMVSDPIFSGMPISSLTLFILTLFIRPVPPTREISQVYGSVGLRSAKDTD